MLCKHTPQKVINSYLKKKDNPTLKCRGRQSFTAFGYLHILVLSSSNWITPEKSCSLLARRPILFSNSPNIFKVTFGFGPALTPFIRQFGIWYLVFGSLHVVVGICYHTKTTIPRVNWYSVFGCCYFLSYFAHDQIWQALCSWTGHGSKVHQIRECRTVFPSLEHFLPQNIFLPPKHLNLQNISFSITDFCQKWSIISRWKRVFPEIRN